MSGSTLYRYVLAVFLPVCASVVTISANAQSLPLQPSPYGQPQDDQGQDFSGYDSETLMGKSVLDLSDAEMKEYGRRFYNRWREDNAEALSKAEDEALIGAYKAQEESLIPKQAFAAIMSSQVRIDNFDSAAGPCAALYPEFAEDFQSIRNNIVETVTPLENGLLEQLELYRSLVGPKERESVTRAFRLHTAAQPKRAYDFDYMMRSAATPSARGCTSMTNRLIKMSESAIDDLRISLELLGEENERLLAEKAQKEQKSPR